MDNIFPYSIKVNVPYIQIEGFVGEEANADEYISWLKTNLGPNGKLWCNHWMRKPNNDLFDWNDNALYEQMEFFFARQEDYIAFSLVYGQ